MCFCLLLVFVIALRLGAVKITTAEILQIIFQKISGGNGFQMLNFDESASNISGMSAVILELRLPRIIASLLVGAGLAVSGAIFQAILQNPLADPYTLGISTGAAFGACLAIMLNITTGIFFPLPLASLIFAALTLLLVLLIAQKSGGAAISSLVMAGIIISSFFSAGLSFLKMMSGENVGAIVLWLMGSFSAKSSGDAILLAAVIPIAIIIAVFFSSSLNILTLGKKAAASLGVNVKTMRLSFLLLASVISAVCVSVCGVIGFVGLIVPHILRLLVSSDNRLLIPLAAISGAVLLCIADTFARTLGSGEIPVGVLTTLAGGPFFIYIFLRRGKIRVL
ncbi:iron ABC transporter permease [Spirochaetia bacterium]|nr:iron ABC transporter permease [Spirochaetia bacterium]